MSRSSTGQFSFGGRTATSSSSSAARPTSGVSRPSGGPTSTRSSYGASSTARTGASSTSRSSLGSSSAARPSSSTGRPTSSSASRPVGGGPTSTRSSYGASSNVSSASRSSTDNHPLRGLTGSSTGSPSRTSLSGAPAPYSSSSSARPSSAAAGGFFKQSIGDIQRRFGRNVNVDRQQFTSLLREVGPEYAGVADSLFSAFDKNRCATPISTSPREA